jgi:recombination protein RecA
LAKKESGEDRYAELKNQLRKKYDPSTVPELEDMIPRPIPTGIPQLDEAIGIGGIPRGRIIDVFGEEAVGKTAFHMILAKNMLERDKDAQIAWIDLEHKLSTSLAEVIGLDLKKVMIIHPPSAEMSFDTMLDLIADFDSLKAKPPKAKTAKPLDMFDLIVYDSVAAAVSDAELEADAGDHVIAPIAKLMASSLKKMLHPLFASRTVVSFINQTRSSPMMRTYGNQNDADKPTGGKALKFYASVRLKIKKSEYLKEGKNVVGLRNTIEVVKNGVAEPFHTATYDFSFKHGVDFVSMLVDEALMSKLIGINGSYFSFGEADNKVQWLGKEKMMDAFRTDMALQSSLTALLKR